MNKNFVCILVLPLKVYRETNSIDDKPNNPPYQHKKCQNFLNLISYCISLSILQASTSTRNELIGNCCLPGVKNVSVNNCISTQWFVTDGIRLSFSYLLSMLPSTEVK